MPISVEWFDDLDAVEADAAGALDRERQPRLYDRLDWFRLTAAHILPHAPLAVLRVRDGDASAWLFLVRTGRRGSRICLGMMSYGAHEERPWALAEEAAEPIVRRAAESGVIFFDTADVYNGGRSEVVTGRLLRQLFGTREEYVVATKVHGRTMPGENGAGLSRKHILASIDASLQRLELDYVVSLLRAEARSRSRTESGPPRFRAPARPAERRA